VEYYPKCKSQNDVSDIHRLNIIQRVQYLHRIVSQVQTDRIVKPGVQCRIFSPVYRISSLEFTDRILSQVYTDRISSPEFTDRILSQVYTDRISSPEFTDRILSQVYTDRISSPEFTDRILSHVRMDIIVELKKMLPPKK
jgi:hypothetical protein